MWKAVVDKEIECLHRPYSASVIREYFSYVHKARSYNLIFLQKLQRRDILRNGSTI